MGVDLADIQLISKYNKDFFCYYELLIFNNKYVRVISLKVKEGIAITNTSQKNLDESYRKPNKICVDKCKNVFNT